MAGNSVTSLDKGICEIEKQHRRPFYILIISHSHYHKLLEL